MKLGTFKQFIEKLDIGEKNASILYDCFIKMNKLNADFIYNKEKEYLIDKKPLNIEMYQQAFSTFESLNINKFTLAAVINAIFFIDMKKRYIENNIDLSIYKDTLNDFKYKFNECLLVKKVPGLVAYEWQSKILNLKIFKIGRLEYELKNFEEDIIITKKVFKTGEKCLAIHIPNSGEPLDNQEVDNSLEKAKHFFRKEFNEAIPCLTWTWLLYHTTLEFVNPSSNIAKFAKRFDILTDYDAKDYSDAWRLFDEDVTTENLATLKEETSLQRKYKAHFLNGGSYGSAGGAFLLKI